MIFIMRMLTRKFMGDVAGLFYGGLPWQHIVNQTDTATWLNFSEKHKAGPNATCFMMGDRGWFR